MGVFVSMARFDCRTQATGLDSFWHFGGLKFLGLGAVGTGRLLLVLIGIVLHFQADIFFDLL